MALSQLTGLTSSDALGYIKTISTKVSASSGSASDPSLHSRWGAERHRRSMLAQVKQMALNLTDLEVKVEEATNNEPWGPHGSVMAGAQTVSFWIGMNPLLLYSIGCRQIKGIYNFHCLCRVVAFFAARTAALYNATPSTVHPVSSLHTNPPDPPRWCWLAR